MSLIIIILDNELQFDSIELPILIISKEISDFLDVLRCVNLFLCFLNILIITLKIKFEKKLFKIKNSPKEINKKFSIAELGNYIFDIITSLIIIPPFIDKSKRFNLYSLVVTPEMFIFVIKKYITIFSFFQIYVLLSQLVNKSPFNHPKANFLK